MEAPQDLAQFCAREHGQLVGALSLYCGDRLLAEELTQEALVKVCQRWESVRAMAAPGAWAHRVAVNLANSRFRRVRARSRALNRHGSGQPQVSDDPDAAEAVALRRAVAGLPSRQREAVVYRFFLDWTVDETAQVMGTTSSSVRSLTYRAIRSLREEFDLGDPSGAKAREVPDGT